MYTDTYKHTHVSIFCTAYNGKKHLMVMWKGFFYLFDVNFIISSCLCSSLDTILQNLDFLHLIYLFLFCFL